MTLAYSAKTFWYLTRGSGVVALLLLTFSIVLGVLSTVRFRSARWPRFAVGSVHRNLTLLAIVFVVLHVVTTIADGYAPVRLTDAVIPFASRYRPIWLGLGAVAFDLLLALVVTSLLRVRLGFRIWRAVHWLAYAAWPIALVHMLGTGSDGRVGWLQATAVACSQLVGSAILLRVVRREGPVPFRLGGAVATLLVPLAVLAWYQSGPGKPGWARRAGTPTTLLASARRVRVVVRRAPVPAALPTTAFVSPLVGTIHELHSTSGLVHVVIRARLGRAPGGAVRIDLRGEPLQGGVTMNASGVSYVPASGRAVYLGSVTSLSGSSVAAEVRTHAGNRLELGFDLNIDLQGGSVSGRVAGRPA